MVDGKVFGPGVEQNLKRIDEHMAILKECDTDSLHLETEALSRKLTSLKETMTNWIAAQEFWQYLVKIHSGKGKQSDEFDALNRQWVELMSSVMKRANAKQTLNDDQSTQHSSDSNTNMDSDLGTFQSCCEDEKLQEMIANLNSEMY